MKSTAILFLLIYLACSSFICNSNQTKNIKPPEKKDSTSQTTSQFKLTDSQKKILEGAKKCLAEKFSYDMAMAYHALTYKNGVNTNQTVYPMGDLDPTLGVCVEVTIRALRYGGIVDLQQAMHEDIKNNFGAYPMKRWDAKTADANIDHRRVPNQLIWFKRNWKDVSNEEPQPGDVVVWDMDKDSWGDHIGIVSDRIENGRLTVIHNFPSPGYVAEEDVFNRWEKLGVFRVK